MQITNISDAKASLSRLVKFVQETDETVIIGRAGEPVAIFSAYTQKRGSGLEKTVLGDFDHFTDGGVVDTKNLCNLF